MGQCSRNPSVSVYQLALLWKAAFGFSEFFLKTLSTCLPMSWWVIYKHTCPHRAEYSAVFGQKRHDPCAPPYLPNLSPSNFFFWFLRMKKVLKGKCFADVEEVKPKTTEVLKGIKIDKFKNFWAMKKRLDRWIASNGEYFEGDWSLNMEE